MLKKKELKIDGQRIYLRILTKYNGTEEYCSWINDKIVNEYLETKKTTIEELRDYIKIRYNDPNCLFLGIFLKDNNFHIGNIKLEPIDFNKKTGTLGILIGVKKFWIKGFGTEALKLLINYAFNTLDLEEINLGVYKENIAAINAYEKSGFTIFKENEKGYKMRVLKDIFYSKFLE